MGTWFAKWFGARVDNDSAEDDEPARFPMGQTSRSEPVQSKPATVKSPSAKGKKKGFDPYNSGSFERRNAWERVGRR